MTVEVKSKEDTHLKALSKIMNDTDMLIISAKLYLGNTSTLLLVHTVKNREKINKQALVSFAALLILQLKFSI